MPRDNATAAPRDHDCQADVTAPDPTWTFAREVLRSQDQRHRELVERIAEGDRAIAGALETGLHRLRLELRWWLAAVVVVAVLAIVANAQLVGAALQLEATGAGAGVTIRSGGTTP